MKNRFSNKVRFAAISVILLGVASLTACSSYGNLEPKHSFTLTGGYFYGPGPIVPDTALPDGKLKGIKFDRKNFRGYATFYNDSKSESILSDGKTLINQNIDAGKLDIGGGNPVLLVAINGGKNKGREYYYLDKDYRFVWKVDLALDPGFPEGIIKINNFTLHTGLAKIPNSVQTQKGIPGGYDQAGSLKSGQYIAGRVGDFDQDGYLDGILVATPYVPLESTMLPGSPVGNQRGFITDIEIPPHLACELVIRGLLQFKAPIDEVIITNNLAELEKLLVDMKSRIESARENMDRALLLGAWRTLGLKKIGTDLLGDLEAVKMLNFIGVGFTTGYKNWTKKVSKSVVHSTKNMFIKLEKLASDVTELNKLTGDKLPDK